MVTGHVTAYATDERGIVLPTVIAEGKGETVEEAMAAAFDDAHAKVADATAKAQAAAAAPGGESGAPGGPAP